jgi:enoyl-CoA hydratase
MSVINTEIESNIAVVTLNRPAQMNALSQDMRTELAEVFAALNADRNVKIAILTGAGERAFCAGLDLKELGAGANIGATVADPNDPVSVMNKFEKPIIGAINGVAITGGFELALACDVLIASSNARFADTHARVGIMPGWGLSQKLSRMIGISRAKELAFTGNFLDAATAYAWGLVNRVVAPDELLRTAKKLAADMAQIELDFLIDYKSLIDSGYAQNFADALAFERTSATAANALVTPEAIEARRAAVQARGRGQ